MSASMRKAGAQLRRLLRNSNSVLFQLHAPALSRAISTAETKFQSKGLVLGVYEPQEKDGPFILTPAAEKLNASTGGKLEPLLKVAGRKLKTGKSRLLYGFDETYTAIAIANLGKQDAGYDEEEQLDVSKENVRTAVAGSVQALREAGETQVEVEPCGDAEAAGEGSVLGLYSFDELRKEENRKATLTVSCFSDVRVEEAHWSRGVKLAEGQNIARRLKEMPSNLMTPTMFCAEVKEIFSKLPHCSVTIRDKAWAESMKMGSFLSVAQGSAEPPLFLELNYSGGKDAEPPVALVGKGITFDSGGISIKPASDMDKMRADMGGAACVVGTMQAAAQLAIPINIKGFIPLCENMPSSTALKPGDVVTAMNGKTIQVDNTDAEGRLILADALCYAETFEPRLIVDIATLTGAIMIALGPGATGAYTKSQALWEELCHAGSVTGDRMWRMPLFKFYSSLMRNADLADLNNIGKKSRLAGSCTAAAFLQEFVTTKEWIHLDIAGVMTNTDDVPYLPKGMSGRPTRTLVQFLDRLSKQKS